MTKEDRNLMRAMFLALFTICWFIASEIKGTEVSPEKWNELYIKSIEISKREE